jgi:hypothetical protein
MCPLCILAILGVSVPPVAYVICRKSKTKINKQK